MLFVAVDDLNHWTGCLRGHPDARTPNIDRLAQTGLLFANAHCQAPLCGGSRTSLLTGKNPWTLGVYRNDQHFRPAHPEIVTLPQHFRSHGYRTLSAGKLFHLEDEASWDEFFLPDLTDATAGREAEDVTPARARGRFTWGAIDADDDDTFDGRLSRWAADLLAGGLAEPFFLAVGFLRPHLPWRVPRKYFALFPPSEISLPVVQPRDLRDVPTAGRRLRDGKRFRQITGSGREAEAVAAYLASMTFADAMIGRVIDALESGPHRGRTAVVLWSDHGFLLGEKSHWGKFVLWEEATRVPLIVAVPDLTTPGGRCDRPVGLIDLYPTLIDLCGLSPADGLEGRSLLPLLHDPGTAWEWPAVTGYRRDNFAVRSQRWRYIRYRDGSEELYDHRQDPLEWRNLAGGPGVTEVQSELARWVPPPAGRAQPL